MNTIASLLSMSDEGISFGSFSADESTPSLKSVTISGDVHGLLFTSLIRQEYKNESGKVLEVLYTFPVAWRSALLGLHVEIGDKRLDGVVIENKQAEQQYEKAIADGDSPVMVQQSAKGLYTVNLGNIKPDDSVVVEIRCARLLSFEQGRIRLCIPTVISERYGDPHKLGVLAPHESAGLDIAARYQFALQIRLFGALAKGGVSCPSHPISSSAIENGLCVTLEDDSAVLDRDFVLLMEGLSGISFAQYVRGEEENMVLASFAPQLPQQALAPLALKILVDCSGSMEGQRIAQAKDGLKRVITELKSDDYISYSKFGSSVQHTSRELCACSPSIIQKLVGYVEETEAILGGTEMENALASVFAHIAMPQGSECPPSVLLITDGDVWDIKNIIQESKASGHRIFAVGVGSAPSESLLREMVEQTGGACEFVTPAENMAKAILRMFHRMRGVAAQNIKIQWGMAPVWQSTPPKFLYDGETVHCFALVKAQPQKLPELFWKAQGKVCSAKAEKLELMTDDNLLRLGKACQMEEAESPKKKLEIALAHQLVSERTSLILTCVREGEDKAKGIPTIQHVWQMPAAGHGCYSQEKMPVGRHGSYPGTTMFRKSSVMHCRYAVNSCAPVLGANEAASTQETELAAIVALWSSAVYTATSFADALAEVLASSVSEMVEQSLIEICQKTRLTQEQVWAVFLEWIFEKTGSGIERHARRLLDTVIPGISQKDLAAVKKRLGKLFP